jgi:hypothetical protein
MADELCAKCGAPVRRGPSDPLARLCPAHMREAIANTPPFADGKDTGSTPGCACDGPCPECPSGKPRKSCSLCEGTGKLCCEFPCWQRVGLTSEPCCPGCAPLDDPAPEPMATVTSLAGSPSGKETPEQDPPE